MIRRLLRSDTGASVVEFAVLAPIFVFLFMGIVDVGRYTYTAIVATHAARSAVQYGSQNLGTAADTTGMQNVANQDSSGVTWSSVTPTYYCTASGGSPMTCPGVNGSVSPTLVYYVQVQVTGSFHPLVTYPGIPNPVTVTSTAIMRVQNQ